MLIIDKILGPIETRTILLVCSKTHEAVLIDPSFYSFRVFSSLIQEKSYKIQKILLTHSHYDHIVDMAKFYNLGIPLYVHPLDKKNVIAPGSDGLRSFKTIEAVSDPQFFQEGDKILFGEVEGVVLETIHILRCRRYVVRGELVGSAYCKKQKARIATRHVAYVIKMLS